MEIKQEDRCQQNFNSKTKNQCRRPRVPGITRCERCAANLNRGQQRRRERRKAAGLCRDCGKARAEKHGRCAICLKLNIEDKRRWEAVRR